MAKKGYRQGEIDLLNLYVWRPVITGLVLLNLNLSTNFEI